MCCRPQKRRRLLSDLMNSSGEAMTMPGVEANEEDIFFVKSNKSDFDDRQRNVFGGLVDLEKKHKEEVNAKNEKDGQMVKVEAEAEAEAEEKIDEFDFAVPRSRAVRRKAKLVPSFVAEPHKWTKISLADVDPQHMSDASNTAAAFSYLREREREKSRRKEDEDEDDDDDKDDDDKDKDDEHEMMDTDSDKILFKCLNKGQRSNEEQSKKLEFRSGKWRMPEYVVGEKSNKIRKEEDDEMKQRRREQTATCSKVGLSHLDDEDVVNDDVNDGNEKEATKEKPSESQQPSTKAKKRKCLRKNTAEDDE